MTEEFLRQSPLAHLGLAAAAVAARDPAHGISLAERPFRALVDLRGRPGEGEFAARAEAALGFALPRMPNTTAGGKGLTALWLGPDQWWIAGPNDGPALADHLAGALEGVFAAVTDISEYYTVIELAGPAARDLLAKGCPMDLHPRGFTVDDCAQSELAKSGVCLHLLAEDSDTGPTFQLYVRRSFADYVWRWLADAAIEYGLSVVR